MKYRDRDKVASQNDQIRMQVVDDFNRTSEWRHGEMFVVVKVAELRYREAIEGSRQTGERDFHRYQGGPVRLKNYAIFAQGQTASQGNPGRNLK